MNKQTLVREPASDILVPDALNAANEASVAWMRERASESQRRWQQVPVPQRLAIVRRLRRRIAAKSLELAQTITYPSRNGLQESLSAEVAPLLEACRFLERRAAKLLRPKTYSILGRPIWLHAVRSEVHRDPYGVVLILGAANYPLLLPGVQTIQSLVAGNAVLLKPSADSTGPMLALRSLMLQSGLDPMLVQILPEAPRSAQEAIALGVDKVLLTGSAATGRAVLQQLAPQLTPATMELSGCDALFVLPSANLPAVARAIRFGLRLNQSATCIAPRRVFVPRGLMKPLQELLASGFSGVAGTAQPNGHDRLDQLADTPAWRSAAMAVAKAMEQGAVCFRGGVTNDHPDGQPRLLEPTVLVDVPPEADILQQDLFAPVVSLIEVSSVEEALARNDACPFGLGASIFGDEDAATQLATRLPAGSIVINDIIVPTADPRVPFGGWRESGFGVTRGAEGLLELTRIKVVQTRRSRWLPHLDPPAPQDAELLAHFLQLQHSKGISDRLSALVQLIRKGRHRGKPSQEDKRASTVHTQT